VFVSKKAILKRINYDGMKCPNCNQTLLIAERHRVEIDYCPNCRGVWLDKGELDKLLDYAGNQNLSSQAPVAEERSRPKDNDRYDYDRRPHDYSENRNHDRHNDHYGQRNYQKKKKSFLSDFFDFD